MVSDHAYLKLSHAELVEVVDALHHSGGLALEQRLRGILRLMPIARKRAGNKSPASSTEAVTRNHRVSARTRLTPNHSRFSGK